MELALYHGPPTGALWRQLGHKIICGFTRSPYSHCELVIDGVCYTSSMTDGGVRSKVIDLKNGKWDVIEIQGDKEKALAWFAAHAGQKYDWLGALKFGFPFLSRGKNRWFCSDAIADALGLLNPESYTPASLAWHFIAQPIGFRS
jgi:hypothetical protein